MNKNRPFKTEEIDMDAATDLSEPRRRQKRVITRKNQNSEKSSESRKMLQRTPRVKEFMPTESNSNYVKTPESVRNQLESIPRLSFNESQMKPFVTYQPLWKHRQHSETNIQSSGELPKPEARTDRDSQFKNDTFIKKIENLKTELDIRNQQLEVLEQDRQRLRRSIDELIKANTLLQGEKKQLRKQVENHKQELVKSNTTLRKLEREKQTLEKKIIAMEKCSANESWNLQSSRERYLERQIQQLRARLGKSKSELERILEAELNRHKQEIFNSLKTVSALKISNDCLQRKLHQYSLKQQPPKICPNDEYVKLRNKYKQFLIEYRSLRREHDKLKQAYDELKCEYEQINNKSDTNEDGNVSLDLSSLNEFSR